MQYRTTKYYLVILISNIEEHLWMKIFLGIIVFTIYSHKLLNYISVNK